MAEQRYRLIEEPPEEVTPEQVAARAWRTTQVLQGEYHLEEGPPEGNRVLAG